MFNAVLEEKLQKSWKSVDLENSFVLSSIGYVQPAAEKKMLIKIIYIYIKNTAKHDNISSCIFLTLQICACNNIHGWPHVKVAIRSGRPFTLHLSPWCQIWLWKQWLTETVAEMWLRNYSQNCIILNSFQQWKW